MAKRDLALDLFHSFQNKQKRTRKSSKEPARELVSENDPQGPRVLKDVLSEVIKDRDWKTGVAEGNLFSDWAQIVGADICAHATPISILDGVLTIQTTSTAWAVQLQMISSQLLEQIRASSPGALVETLTIIGPLGPSWKKGIRTIRGAKGPRDTYG